MLKSTWVTKKLNLHWVGAQISSYDASLNKTMASELWAINLVITYLSFLGSKSFAKISMSCKLGMCGFSRLSFNVRSCTSFEKI